MKYEDSRFSPLEDDFASRELPRELQEILFVTKYSHWAYERELRAFVDLAKTIKEGALHSPLPAVQR